MAVRGHLRDTLRVLVALVLVVSEKFWDSGEMEVEDPGGPLSNEELRELDRLLARYATRELDQWDAWKIHMYTCPSDPYEYEPVYIVMSRGLLPNWQDKTFTTIWPLPAHLEEDQHANRNQQE